MAKTPTAHLGLQIPVPGSMEPFRVVDFNAIINGLDTWADTVDTTLTSHAGRLTTVEGRATTLETDVETLQDRVTARPADLTALAALATGELLAGDLARVTEGGALFMWDGSAWVQITMSRFATEAARDTAYAKASSAYLVQGVESLTTDTGCVWRYYAAYNVSTNKGGALAAGWYPHAGTPYAAHVGLSKSSVTSEVNMDMTVQQDVFGLVNTSTDRITVQKAGWYKLTAQRAHSGTTANTLRAYVNGLSVAVDARTGASGASSSGGFSVEALLAVGDYVEFRISAAASTNFTDSQNYGMVEFAGVRIA